MAMTAMMAGGAAGSDDPARIETGEVSHEVNRTHTYGYVLALPPGEAADGAEAGRRPMVIDLHGSGRPSLESLAREAAGRDARFAWLLPRHDGRGWWDADTLAKLVEHVVAQYPVDRDRVTVMGFSMGGFGAWDFATEYPWLVAGIVPMAGGGNPFKARRLTHVPVWAFHGQQDETVQVELARAMVEAARRAGSEARLTVYPEVGHGIRELVMSHGRLGDWLFARRRGTRAPDEWVTPTGRAPELEVAPALDGALGHKAWRRAARITGFMRPLGARPAEVQTEVRLGSTQTHLYVGFTAWDPDVGHLRVERAERDAEVWLDDSVEVLIDTDRDQETYFQFVANARGALYDARGFDGSWDAEGVAIATGRQADRWTVELAIPWQALGRRAPAPGQTLGMLFARTHHPAGRPRYYTQWPPTNGRGNHAPDRFAPVVFGEAAAAE